MKQSEITEWLEEYLIYWKDHWTSVQGSLQLCFQLPCDSLCPAGQGASLLWNSLSLSVHVCWEGGEEELLDKFKVLYDWFTKGLGSEVLKRGEQQRDKKNREDEKEEGRKIGSEGEKWEWLKKNKPGISVQLHQSVLKLVMRYSIVLYCSDSVVPRPAASAAPGNLLVLYTNTTWVLNSGDETLQPVF